MKAENLVREAENLQGELVAVRRKLHACAETGFELPRTLETVKEELKKIGYQPKDCGRAGVVAQVGRGNGKTVLLRADMDALPIAEQSGEEFAANNGNAHACGHDLHTAMLLGAAKLLKAHERELCGNVRLMFQPAEELLEGARDMIEAGVLENPAPSAAWMIHVMAGFPTGKIIVNAPGVSAPAADYFRIEVRGKGCHGAMPNTGVDPVAAGAHIVVALQQIAARELSMNDRAVLTAASFHAGDAPNAIPSTAELTGSLRAYDEETRKFLKKRLVEIAEGTANVFRAEAAVSFTSGCPTLLNDGELSACTERYLTELFGGDVSAAAKSASSGKVAGSEDFAYVSHETPSLMIALGAGTAEEGCAFPQHHPKVKFREEVLSRGSAIFAYTAMRWLEEHGAE